MNWLIITVYANLNILSHQNNTPNRFFRDCEKKSTSQQAANPTSSQSKIPKTSIIRNLEYSKNRNYLSAPSALSAPINQSANFSLMGIKKRERQIALSLSVGGGYLLSHFRSTIGVVRLNFSVRNGKRWDPHAMTTLVRFQCARHYWLFVAPVIRLKEISGNAGLNSLIEQASRISAPSALRKASGRLRPHSGLLRYRLFRVGR